ncbi:MAG TPA: methylmalonyl Co-A mutase-associated GTPase MeaB [Acidobacteriaceae bacterium]|nr:methylmalonyl Co-A mutase-associated GTPase MeaB [Acidobacteriaceae bacterium]
MPPPALAPLIDRLRQGDTRALARALTLVENDAPEAPALLSACFPHSGRALRLGITGAPGAGKSTVVDRLARAFRAQNRTVGVLAVDPTSPFTGGALLGDRIRVAGLHDDPGFTFRSMATRGSLGGLALSTADCALVLEASGKDVVLIETVGVGQDEIEIARLADITLVVLVPGMGDDVQSLKAGVMEIADIYVINKADREGAHRVEQEIRALQSLATKPEDRTPPIVRTIATTGEGIDTLAASIADMHQWLQQDNRLTQRRALHWRRRLDAMLRAELMRRARKNGFDAGVLQFHAARIASGQQDPWQLVAQLSQKVFSGS